MEYISTRFLVKKLAEQLGYDPHTFSILKDELGKPYGEANKLKLFLSIAHTNKLVICGISEEMDMGIDIEPADRSVNEKVADRILHPDEPQGVRELDLVRLWTIKEALVKLEGRGLRTNLNEVLVSGGDNQLFHGRFNNDKRAKICSFRHQNHWISVAYFG